MNPASATSETDEVVVTLRLRFKPGTIDHVLERMLPAARKTREEIGNIGFDVFRARDDGAPTSSSCWSVGRTKLRWSATGRSPTPRRS